jgi:hypothetical protein
VLVKEHCFLVYDAVQSVEGVCLLPASSVGTAHSVKLAQVRLICRLPVHSAMGDQPNQGYGKGDIELGDVQ